MSFSALVTYNSGAFHAYLDQPGYGKQNWIPATKEINAWALGQDPSSLKAAFEGHSIRVKAQGDSLPVEVVIARMNMRLHTGNN